MKKNELDFYLLKILNHDGNIEPLIELGYDYLEVIQLVNDIMTQGYASTNNDGVIKVTNEGKAKIKSLEKVLNKENQSKWIEPEYKSKITPLKRNEIYVPFLEELSKFN